MRGLITATIPTRSTAIYAFGPDLTVQVEPGPKAFLGREARSGRRGSGTRSSLSRLR